MAKKTTRNAKGAGMIRHRKDGLWEARYTAGYDPGTGKQIQKSVYGKTQAEVRKKLTQYTRQIDEGVYTEPSKMTVSVWLDIWLKEYIQDTVKPFTVKSYETLIRIHINPALGAARLTELTTPAIQQFYNRLKRGTKEKAPLSPKTIKNVHGVLHASLKKAVALRYLSYNPSDACELPRIVKKEIQPLDETAIAAFLKAVQGDKYELVYLVTLFTGMREGEILGLTWDAIDFENGTITISRQLQKEKKTGGKYYLTDPKNSKPRTITPAPYVMDLLRHRLAQQQAEQKRAGELWNNEWNLVFTNEVGRYLVAVTVYKNFKKRAAEIGIPTARFHDLRHSYAVAALQSGDDVKTVQDNLGHHTAAFTLDVYGHVTERMKRDSANRMQAFIETISKPTKQSTENSSER